MRDRIKRIKIYSDKALKVIRSANSKSLAFKIFNQHNDTIVKAPISYQLKIYFIKQAFNAMIVGKIFFCSPFEGYMAKANKNTLGGK